MTKCNAPIWEALRVALIWDSASARRITYIDVQIDLSGGDEEHTAESDRTRGRIEARGDRLAHGAHEVAVPLAARVGQQFASPHFDVDQRNGRVATSWQRQKQKGM